MIFEELIIHNYGIYKGRHTIDLSPKSDTKPIILFGGLNGSGKTTFLDALQLTLYGKFARCSNRGNLVYNDYLRETINRHCSAEEGASLELKFSTYIDGDLNSYQVRRFWHAKGKTIKENMEVIHNNKINPVMTEQWYEYVNEFIPLNISGLFFFDGEKIGGLADPEGSADLIRTGITALLGLDIVDKLDSDLTALLRTGLKVRNKDKGADKENTETAKQELKLVQLNLNKEELSQDIASLHANIASLKSSLKKLKSQYRRSGGDLFDQRQELESNLATTIQSLESKESELRRLAEDIAPLGLVSDLITQTQQQAEAETEGRETKLLLSKFQQRDSKLLAQLKKKGATDKSISLVKSVLLNDTDKRKQSVPSDFYLNIDATLFNNLDKSAFSKVKKTSETLCVEASGLRENLFDAQQKLASIPEGATLSSIQQQIDKDNTAIIQEKGKISLLTEQLRKVTSQYSQAELRLTNLKLGNNKNIFEAELQNRIKDNIGDVQSILTKFHLGMVKKHIKHLEVLIYESFIALVRKSDLIKQVSIEPETYNLTLLDQHYNQIPTSRLSAGERQILAISILWGLAKASGRPLPAIIDTPLGRLDSKHRQNLIDSYFPKASHQVILLSTDQEIDQSYRNKLSKYIGREYHIQYDEEQQSSTITKGYF